MLRLSIFGTCLIVAIGCGGGSGEGSSGSALPGPNASSLPSSHPTVQPTTAVPNPSSTGSSPAPSSDPSSTAEPGVDASATGPVAAPVYEEPAVTFPETLACASAFPTADVSAADYRVTAGGDTWGPLPHFWTTYGLGRMGLYLDRDTLAPEFQAQDRESFDGRRWSQILREQTTEAVQTLELRSIRGHGLFHDDIGIYSEDEDGNPLYDFTRSDDIFDFLVENGVAPIVELAPMPSALAADPSQTVFDWKMIVSPPKDYAKWEGLVREFVRHSVDRYGEQVVRGWHWEVWNEPECCSNKFWKGSLDDYFQLYESAVSGVRAILPDGRVGGPVSSQPSELEAGSMAGRLFLDHVAANDSALDFFAFHSWSFLESITGYFQGLDLLDRYGHTDVQIAVTEFGPTWEFGLRGVEGTAGTEPEWEPQETLQGAAFVAQTYADIAQRCALEGKRYPLTYAWWTLSDVFDEGYDDPGDYVLEDTPFIGAMGLFSREGIKKPAFNVYSFLARLGDEQRSLSVTGEGNVGGMAARDTTNGGMQVLLYNGQNPGGGFRDDLYYSERAAQAVGVTVTGLNPALAYDVTVYRVDNAHGNAWGAWDELGRPAMANMDDAAWGTLRDSMQSSPEPVGRAMCGETFSSVFDLSSPGVLLLTLEPALPR